MVEVAVERSDKHTHAYQDLVTTRESVNRQRRQDTSVRVPKGLLVSTVIPEALVR